MLLLMSTLRFGYQHVFCFSPKTVDNSHLDGLKLISNLAALNLKSELDAETRVRKISQSGCDFHGRTMNVDNLAHVCSFQTYLSYFDEKLGFLIKYRIFSAENQE